MKRPVSALTFRSRGFLESARNAIPSNPTYITYKHDVKTTGHMKTTARSDQFPIQGSVDLQNSHGFLFVGLETGPVETVHCGDAHGGVDFVRNLD